MSVVIRICEVCGKSFSVGNSSKRTTCGSNWCAEQRRKRHVLYGYPGNTKLAKTAHVAHQMGMTYGQCQAEKYKEGIL